MKDARPKQYESWWKHKRPYGKKVSAKKLRKKIKKELDNYR